MVWYYNGVEFTENMIGDYYGFCYEVENLVTGQKYIGRKFFSMAARKQVKGKKKKYRKSSDWQTYYGSGSEIIASVKEHGPENFRRTIIHLCRTLGECKYMETKILFEKDVLKAKLPDGRYAFYNANIMMKYTRRNIG